MAVIGQEWYMIRGEDVAFPFSPELGAVDISLWRLRWQLRPSDGSPIIAINKDNVSVGGLMILDGLYGLLQVNLYSPDTANLVVQRTPWFWELRRFDPGASTALARGTLVIAAENAQP